MQIAYLVFRFLALINATHAPAEHVLAATLAETSQIPASLLLAQSHHESRWLPNAVSRAEQTPTGELKRRGGVWAKPFPKYFKPPYFCGASQIKRLTERACRELDRALIQNYAEARDHIGAWLKYCRAKKQPGMTCALAGYGSGVKLSATRYGLRVQRLARFYELKIEKNLTRAQFGVL